MSLASWLAGGRFRLVQAGRTKFESECLTVEKALAQGIGECFFDVVSLFLRKVRRLHLGNRHGAAPGSGIERQALYRFSGWRRYLTLPRAVRLPATAEALRKNESVDTGTLATAAAIP